jgi:hypothetical protein
MSGLALNDRIRIQPGGNYASYNLHFNQPQWNPGWELIFSFRSRASMESRMG